MRKIVIVVFLLSFAVVAYGAPECDFSSSSDVNVQKCFGGSGNQCEEGFGRADAFHPVKLNKSDCTATAYVTIGSIMHDNCCLNNPKEGYMCGKSGDNILSGNDQQICGFEWNKAFYDSRDGRGWEVTMGPYIKGGKTDDLTRKPAREGRIYDKNGNNRRMWVQHQKNPGDKLWKHAIWSNVQETVASRKLKAPKGTKFQEKEDEAFCASGKWANGACQ